MGELSYFVQAKTADHIFMTFVVDISKRKLWNHSIIFARCQMTPTAKERAIDVT